MSDDLYDGPCEAGCQHFHGGEVRHHKDCGHYPESLTKLNADRIEELEGAVDWQRGRAEAAEANLAKAVDIMCIYCDPMNMESEHEEFLSQISKEFPDE